VPIDEPMTEEDISEDESLYAFKFLRIFTTSDESSFSIFAEYGMLRKYVATLVADDEIELNIKMPVPPDDLIIKAGYHAVKVQRLEEFDEDYYFQAPAGRRFAPVQKETNKAPIYYPSNDFPEWVVFKFDLEAELVEFSVAADVDIHENLQKLIAKTRNIASS
jgi:hypothetical protein